MNPPMTLEKFQELLQAAGYNYGSDAAENALVGYELADEVNVIVATADWKAMLAAAPKGVI